MDRLFIDNVSLGIGAGWMILAVSLFRMLWRKTPRGFLYGLWILVGIRLLLPFQLKSIFSLAPGGDAFEKAILSGNISVFSPEVLVPDQSADEFAGEQYYEGVMAPDGLKTDLSSVLALVWLSGALLMVLWGIYSYRKLKGQVRTATVLGDKIWQSENITTPFVMGIIRPEIYLPYGVKGEDMQYILAHEQVHICRKDYLVKIVGFLLLSVYWYHPLVWLWYVMLGRDMESSCDERVIREFSRSRRQDYATALLNCSTGYSGGTFSPLSFGGTEIRKRIGDVMGYRAPTAGQVALSALLSVVIVLCFMTSPAQTGDLPGRAFFQNRKTEVFGLESYGPFEDFKGYSRLDIFPRELPAGVQEGSYAYRAEDTFLDPTVQIFLECTYSEEAYEQELERLGKIQEEYEGQVKSVRRDEEHFRFPAYVTVYANNHCYEYALLTGERKIAYVFLQFAEKEDILFDSTYLPGGYRGSGEHDRVGGDSIYIFYQENGDGICLY